MPPLQLTKPFFPMLDSLHLSLYLPFLYPSGRQSACVRFFHPSPKRRNSYDIENYPPSAASSI